MKRRLTPRDMAHIAIFAALIAICAWLSLPTVIPVTLQTFAFFLAAFLLGGRKGSICVVVYLLLGVIGLPVFSFFRGGPAALFGATGGYLLGFIPAALLLWLLEKWVQNHPLRRLFAALAALSVCYAFGTLWYAAFYLESSASLRTVFASCVLPFLLPDFLKLLLALFLSSRLNIRSDL